MEPTRHEEPRKGSRLSGADADEQNEELERQGRAETERLSRMMQLVAASSMTVEQSLKAAAMLQGMHPESTKQAGHDINNCLQQVTEPVRGALAPLVTAHGLSPAAITTWRVHATYPDIVIANWHQADEDAYAYVDTAVSVTRGLLEECARSGVVSSECEYYLAAIQALRERGSIRWDDLVDVEAGGKASAGVPAE